MKTWLVACSKGGVGKTTIATHLAAESALSGLHTALVDADRRGHDRWCERRAGLAHAVLPVDGTAIMGKHCQRHPRVVSTAGRAMATSWRAYGSATRCGPISVRPRH